MNKGYCGMKFPTLSTDLHEREVGFPAASAVSVCVRVLQTPKPEQSARCSVKKGGLVAMI